MFVLNKAIALVLALLAQQQAAENNFKPLGEITGTDSAIEQPMAMLITDQRSLTQLWHRHKELVGDMENQGQVLEAQVPQVDFKKNTVLAYFAGQTKGIMGFEIVNVDVKGKTNIVRIAPKTFSGVGGAVLANGFGMWVFPHTKKPIELELVLGYESGQPVIRKIARLEPPKPAARTSGG